MFCVTDLVKFNLHHEIKYAKSLTASDKEY